MHQHDQATEHAHAAGSTDGHGAVDLPGVHVSPNIQGAPDLYEVENAATDPEGRLWAAMEAVAPWGDKVVLDIGAGSGYHLARFHERARHVIAVEPHDPSRLLAMERVVRLGLTRTSVMTGSAERLLLPDGSVDVAHARFAYFFAPECEPGLAELARVVRPGGVAVIIDNDLRSGTFASWLRRSPWLPCSDADAIEGFWAAHGFTLTRVTSAWRFADRETLEAVVRNEFPPDPAGEILTEHQGTTVDYHFCLYHRHY